MLQVIQSELRLPDGIVAVYTPVYIQYIPSPSRVLSVMDALLPVGILTTCLEGNSYVKSVHIGVYSLPE